MAREQVWFNVPQVVVLLATRDLDLTLKVAASNPDLLLVKANRILGERGSVPLDAGPESEESHKAVRQLRQEKLTGEGHVSRYLETQERLPGLLATGVWVQASTEPGGQLTRVDPVEFTRLKFRGLDAIDTRTGEVVFYDVRIDAFGFVEKLSRAAQEPDSRSTERPHGADQWTSLKERMSACRGDRLPLLIEWARLKYRNERLPGREQMLHDFRRFFGQLVGVNEKTMREVRRCLAIGRDRRGGAPTHRRYLPE